MTDDKGRRATMVGVEHVGYRTERIATITLD